MAEDAVSVRDMAEQAGKEYDESQKSNAQEESSASEVEQTPEEKELFEDREYQDLKKGIDDDVSSQKNIHPRFREVYKKWKDAQRQLDELANQEPQAPEITEDDLYKFAQEKGYVLSKQQQDAAKEEARLQALLDKVQSPEDRQFLKTYADGIREEARKEFEEKYGQPLSQFQQIAVEYKLQRSEDQARQLIKQINERTGSTIDFDKDVDPALAKMINSSGGRLNVANTDIYKLTREWLADKGVELGKQLSVREQQKLNEEKKKAGMESQSTSSTPKVDYSNASIRDILKSEAKKQGAESFFSFGE